MFARDSTRLEQEIVGIIGLFITPRLITILLTSWAYMFDPFLFGMVGVLAYRFWTNPEFRYTGLAIPLVGGTDYLVTGMNNPELYHLILPYYGIVLSALWIELC